MFDIDKAKALYGCKNVYGPYTGTDSRQRVVLYYSKGNTTSKSYPRFVAEVTLGKILGEDFEVDHDDANRSNDSLENFKILTKEEHKAKSALEATLRTNDHVLVACPQCESPFHASKWQLGTVKTPCCSVSCARKYSGANQYSKFGTKYQE